MKGATSDSPGYKSDVLWKLIWKLESIFELVFRNVANLLGNYTKYYP